MDTRTLDATAAFNRAYSATVEAEFDAGRRFAETRDERLCSDMDEFGNWLGAQMMFAPVIDLGYVPGPAAPQSTLDRFHMRVEAMTVPQLMCLALQGNTWAPMAMRVMRERYLQEKGQ